MSNEAALARHALLVRSLLRGDALAAPPAERELIETHISSVVLAGGYVYKLRKPLKLDFLDFSTPALRRSVADACGAPFTLLECHAPEPLLRERIARRTVEAQDASDADERVLDLHLRVREPAAAEEAAVRFDTEGMMDVLERRCETLAAQLRATQQPTESPLP